MPKFTLPVTWMMSGTVTVEAETLDDAIQKAYSLNKLPDGEYVPDSFEVHDPRSSDDEQEFVVPD